MQIEEKTKQLENLPSKKSNHQKLLKKFFKIAENPCEFYKSLNYNDKRVFQNIMFPEGFKFSLIYKECRTSKVNMIFDLTNSFKANYANKKEKTQIQNVLEYRLVAGTGLTHPSMADSLDQNKGMLLQRKPKCWARTVIILPKRSYKYGVFIK